MEKKCFDSLKNLILHNAFWLELFFEFLFDQPLSPEWDHLSYFTVPIYYHDFDIFFPSPSILK